MTKKILNGLLVLFVSGLCIFISVSEAKEEIPNSGTLATSLIKKVPFKNGIMGVLGCDISRKNVILELSKITNRNIHDLWQNRPEKRVWGNGASQEEWNARAAALETWDVLTFVHFVEADLDKVVKAAGGYGYPIGEKPWWGYSYYEDFGQGALTWARYDNLPQRDNLLDGIVSLDEKLDKLSLKEIIRVLRPGGKAILDLSKDGRESAEKWVGDAKGIKWEITKDEYGQWLEIIKK